MDEAEMIVLLEEILSNLEDCVETCERLVVPKHITEE